MQLLPKSVKIKTLKMVYVTLSYRASFLLRVVSCCGNRPNYMQFN